MIEILLALCLYPVKCDFRSMPFGVLIIREGTVHADRSYHLIRDGKIIGCEAKFKTRTMVTVGFKYTCGKYTYRGGTKPEQGSDQ